MIVTLEDHADSEAVRRALAGRGLWIKRFESEGEGPVQYPVEARSSSAGATELRSLVELLPSPAATSHASSQA